jgi:DNA-binding CsgD family transcriptional regulator
MIGAMRRRFVGRAAELAALEAALAQAGEGRPAVVLVGGEAGVGKTRLVGELAGRAAERGALVATGTCVELTAGTAPYLAFTDALRDLARAVGPRAWDRLRAGVPGELAGVLPGAGDASDARADATGRARLLGQAHDLLAEAAAAAPLLLALEDVHWADRSTLDLAGFLARSLRDERIALVATFRSDETQRRHGLRAWLSELGRVEGVRRIDLEPFDEAEIAELLGSSDSALVASIARRSGGNAFLAEELLDAGESGLPASIRDLLATRIAALPRDAQVVLRAAAAAGARVDDELLAALVSVPDLPAALRAAVAHHLLAADERDGRLAFRHELVREAAYAELLPGERRRLHAACARALEERPELGESPASTAASVARHWDAASEPARALAASLRAAEAAVSVHAPAEALVLYQRALALWDQVPDPVLRRLDVLERAAETAVHAGEAEVALALLDEALALADPESEPVRTGILHSQRAWYSWPAGAAGSSTYEHHASALALIPAEPPSKARARAVTDVAYTNMLDGHMSAAREQALEAVAVARRAGAREIEGLALNVLGAARGMLGEPEDAVACLRDAVAIARETGGAEALGRAFVNLSSTLDVAGRLEQAVEAALEGAATTRRLGLARHWSAFLAGNAAESLLTLGRLDEAQALIDDALADDVSGMARIHLTTLSAELALERGEHATCEAALDAVDALKLGAHSAELEGTVARIRAELAADVGRYEEARAAVRDGLERLADDRVVAGLVAVGVAVEAAVGDPPAAATIRGLLERLDQLDETSMPMARAFVLTARAEAKQRDLDSWRAAAAAWDALPCPCRAGRARLREAEALLAAGAPRADAAIPLRAALATARETGSLRLLRAAEALASRTGLAGRESDAVLTAREREVLLHVAAGRTNRQIAEALYISPRTAGVHVSRILAKLGAATRGEAAAAGRLAGVVDDERVENLVRLTHPRKLG